MAEGTSILNSMKKLLGIDAEYDVFDQDIMIHINTVFSVLQNIGATPPAGFMILGQEETWENFLEDRKSVEMVKTYMYLRVRLIFDPPTSTAAMDAFKKTADELEWRLNTMELVFNPLAYNGLIPVVPVEPLDAKGNFAPDAPTGSIGVDADGNLWQDVEQ